MPRNPNTHGGGALTNVNGLSFEQITSLDEVLNQSGYVVTITGEVYSEDKLVGYSRAKHQFRKFLEANGVDLSVNSDVLLPDNAFINILNETVYIIEKKFQSVASSVDEKLQTCPYKRRQYYKLVSQIEYDIAYTYVLNDWFKQPKYYDVLKFIKECGCYYFFNELPLQFLNI